MPIIIRGAVSRRTEWPWLAALMYSPTNIFFCGASIISQNHLLTAAHCLYDENHIPLGVNDFFAHVGRYDLRSSNQESSKFYPTRTITHRLFNNHGRVSEHDIAIIYSTSSINLNDMTQIVCLWTGQIESEKISRSTAAGRGVTETGRTSNIPMKTDVKMTRCYNANYFPVNGEDLSICGKGVDSGRGSSEVCRGDSGSGLYVEANGIWFVRGVTSNGAVSEITGQCVPTEHATYTNVAAFHGWIQNAIYTTTHQPTFRIPNFFL